MIMNTMEACPISGEFPHEERINFLTHFLGFLLSIVGALWIINASAECGLWCVVSSTIYAISLVSLYGASAYYHRSQKLSQKRILKIIDHICIYLLIAGTYTPFVLGPLREVGGWNLFFIVWSIAVAGILFKVFFIDRFEKLSVFAYVAMGWLIMVSFSTLIETVSTVTLLSLIAGGLSYSFGTLFYLWRSFPYNHSIWHVFVLGGSSLHYFSVLSLIA